MKPLACYILLLFSFYQHPCSAQILKGHYIPFSLGYAHQVVKDESLSPVSYSGGIAQIGLAYYYHNAKWISQLDINGYGGFQKPDAGESRNRTNLLSGRAIYTLARKVAEYRNSAFYAGLSSHNSWDYRDMVFYSNSSFNYNALFSGGPYLAVRRDWTLFGKEFGLQYGLIVPVFTYYLRPGYIKPITAGDFSARGFAYWDSFYQIDSRMDIYWKINTANLLRLSYQWEYTQLVEPNKLQMGNHFISISSIFKI